MFSCPFFAPTALENRFACAQAKQKGEKPFPSRNTVRAFTFFAPWPKLPKTVRSFSIC
jgi:hypothetical protein